MARCTAVRNTEYNLLLSERKVVSLKKYCTNNTKQKRKTEIPSTTC